MLPILSAVGTKAVASHIEIENSQRIYHIYCGWNEMLLVISNLKTGNTELFCCEKKEKKKKTKLIYREVKIESAKAPKYWSNI